MIVIDLLPLPVTLDDPEYVPGGPLSGVLQGAAQGQAPRPPPADKHQSDRGERDAIGPLVWSHSQCPPTHNRGERL